MSRAPNGGWDFVKVGKVYQYKEDGFIAFVTVLEDNSDEEFYRFKLRPEKASEEPFFLEEDGTFEICHVKKMDGVYSGMLQLYEQVEYMCNYRWQRN
jgi:hypothetical protein